MLPPLSIDLDFDFPLPANVLSDCLSYTTKLALPNGCEYFMERSGAVTPPEKKIRTQLTLNTTYTIQYQQPRSSFHLPALHTHDTDTAGAKRHFQRTKIEF